MKDTLIIGAAILVAIAIGAWLMFGTPVPGPAGEEPVAFSVLKEGDNASALSERKNYRLKTQQELDELWALVGEGAAPTVDFSTSEVLAAFDGVHPTGGYSVRFVSVDDIAQSRRVVIAHTAPGDGCMTTEALSSPFTMVVVPKSDLPISRIDQEQKNDCD